MGRPDGDVSVVGRRRPAREERGRRRRLRRPRTDSYGGEVQLGEAETTAVPAWLRAAGVGDTVRRPAEAGARARARVRVSAGARSRGVSEERQSSKGGLLILGQEHGSAAWR